MILKFCSLVLLYLLHTTAGAQVTDIFRNKTYHYNTGMVKAAVQKAYAPSQVEILQSILTDPVTNSKRIETQLQKIAIGQLENEVAFFHLHTKAQQYQRQLHLLRQQENGGTIARHALPEFKDISITLMSMLNQTGVYRIRYTFDEVSVHNYYLADYGKNRITAIPSLPGKHEQEVLKQLTLARFTTLYLLQTQKLDLDNVERVKGADASLESTGNFAAGIDYSEALIYPYFSGIVVEFPAYSKSSALFDNKPFRMLLTGEELMKLLTVYPVLKPLFNTIKPPSPPVAAILDNDTYFNLLRFQSAPKELDMLESICQNGKSISSLSINNYQLTDTVKRFMGTKTIFFNNSKQVSRIEERNDQDKIATEEHYRYNTKGQLTDIRTSKGDGHKLKLCYYRDGLPSYEEAIERTIFRTAYGKAYTSLEISQQHFAYSNDHRYVLRFFNLVGALDRNIITESRSAVKNQYCTNYYCLLTRDNGHVTGVYNKTGPPVDILVNDRNQPVETYFDNDRYRYRFNYDDRGRIRTFTSVVNGERSDVVSYDYHADERRPWTTTHTRTANSNPIIILHEYEAAFRK